MTSYKFSNPLTEDEVDYLLRKKRYEERAEMFGDYNWDYILILNPIKPYVHPDKRKYKKLWIVE